MEGKLENAKQFIQGGNATFTILNPKTGNRFTYKVRQINENAPYFVSLLRGQNNEADYSYIGFIKNNQFIWGGRKAKANKAATSVKAFQWTWKHLAADKNLDDVVEIYHQGQCGRCGRALTVPASVKSGFGPTCINLV